MACAISKEFDSLKKSSLKKCGIGQAPNRHRRSTTNLLYHGSIQRTSKIALRPASRVVVCQRKNAELENSWHYKAEQAAGIAQGQTADQAVAMTRRGQSTMVMGDGMLRLSSKMGGEGFGPPTFWVQSTQHVFYGTPHGTTPMKAALHGKQHHSTALYTVPLQNCYTGGALFNECQAFYAGDEKTTRTAAEKCTRSQPGAPGDILQARRVPLAGPGLAPLSEEKETRGRACPLFRP